MIIFAYKVPLYLTPISHSTLSLISSLSPPCLSLSPLCFTPLSLYLSLLPLTPITFLHPSLTPFPSSPLSLYHPSLLPLPPATLSTFFHPTLLQSSLNPLSHHTDTPLSPHLHLSFTTLSYPLSFTPFSLSLHYLTPPSHSIL